MESKDPTDANNNTQAPGAAAAGGANEDVPVTLKPNLDKLKCEKRLKANDRTKDNTCEDKTKATTEDKTTDQVTTEENKTKQTVEGEDSESDDIILKGLQSDDSFHGMLPDEDINKLLQNHGDYILHTVDKDDGKGRVIGMSCMFNNEKVFIQVRAGDAGVTFDAHTYKPTILDLAKHHLTEGIPVQKTKFGEGIVPKRPVLREDWELRHEDIELLEKLGEGAFGEVKLGKLKQKNKGSISVAIKIIKGSVNKKAIEDAMKEARIMRQYNHPNVVRFYGVQAVVEPFMLLMEYVKGGSLKSYVKKNCDDITPENRASMCYDAACGLEYLHLQDCIHRDIASRNCLVDAANQRLKISDFGLSSIGAVQMLDPSKPAPIRWLSPEVMQTGAYAKPADVWSYGVLCWEIYMDAEVPYKGYTMAEVQEKIQDEEFRLQLPSTCQAELKKVIETCWTGDPEKRPTMSDVVKALKPYFEDKKQEKKGKKKNKKKKAKKDDKAKDSSNNNKEIGESKKKKASEDTNNNKGESRVSRIVSTLKASEKKGNKTKEEPAEDKGKGGKKKEADKKGTSKESKVAAGSKKANKKGGAAKNERTKEEDGGGAGKKTTDIKKSKEAGKKATSKGVSKEKVPKKALEKAAKKKK